MTKLLAVLALLATLGLPNTAHAGWRSAECRFATLEGGTGFSDTEIRKTIWCAEHKWSVNGGVRMALCIAARESRFDEYADNPDSSASGVFQIVDGTWHSWRFDHLVNVADRYRIERSVWNGRANVMIGVHAMHRWGLSPWGGGC